MLFLKTRNVRAHLAACDNEFHRQLTGSCKSYRVFYRDDISIHPPLMQKEYSLFTGIIAIWHRNYF